MGHPDFSVTRGSLTFRGKNFLILQPHERARGGLFLAFQHPRSIPGITLRSFLFASYNAQMSVRQKRQRLLSPVKFREMLSRKMGELHMDPILAERSLNLGFSGGEKKKAEVLQLSVCEPLLALLDETDAGLDIDALRVVAKGLKRLRKSQKFPPLSLLLVTHYARILRELTPDVIHIMVRGRIVESGGSALANRLEKEGYRRYLTKVRV
jgi:Fe-S cluster assembly ATP-binding protein